MTAARSLIDASRRLAEREIEDPRLEAEVLLASALGISRSQLLARTRDLVPYSISATFEKLLARRLRREPLAYILGYREFYGRRFKVTRDVLIPRPESELLVEGALAWLKIHPAGLVVDIGAGSGAIGLSIAAEAPQARLLATDISPDALAVAIENATALQVRERCEFVLADLGTALSTSTTTPKVVVANLPYIAPRQKDELAPEIRDYEPPMALFGGKDGLAVIQTFVGDLRRWLGPKDLAILEVGIGQAASVTEIAEREGLASEAETDLAGIVRVIAIRRDPGVRVRKADSVAGG